MNPILTYPLVITLLISAVSDLRFQKIPNRLTFTAMLAGLSLNAYLTGIDGLIASAAGILLGTGIFILPYAMGGMGAGDAKLMGAVGSFLGIGGVFIAALLAMIVGGVYAVFLMLRHRQHAKEMLSGIKESFVSLALTHRFTPSSKPAIAETAGKPRLCYGAAIAGGTFLYMIMEAADCRFLPL